MAFCTNCGSQVEGAFCPQCGTPAKGPTPAPTPTPVYSGPSNMPQPAAPGGNKGLKIVLFGCLGVIVLGAIMATVTGLFVAKKVHDVTSSEGGPLMAAAKIAIAANPELEVVSTDDQKGTITVREKATGKTLTVSFEDIKNGKLVFEGDKGEKMAIGGKTEGDAGIEIQTPEGTARMGGGAVKLPDWLPAYPGAKGSGLFTSNTKEGESGSAGFETSDSADKVEAFYKDALEDEGIKPTRTALQSGENSVVILNGKSSDGNRMANITVTKGPEGTKFNITYQSK